MHFSLRNIALVLGLSAAAQAFNDQAIRAFNKGDKVRAKHEARRQALPQPERVQLEKRQSKFNTPAAQKFAVNGTDFPLVDFDLGEVSPRSLPECLSLLTHSVIRWTFAHLSSCG